MQLNTVERGDGAAITEIVVLTPNVSFDTAIMRGAIMTVPEVLSAVNVNRSDDASEGFTHTLDKRAPETLANEIAARSAEMETPARLGRMVQDSDRRVDTREWNGAASSAKLLYGIEDVVSGSAVITMTVTADEPIAKE